VAPPVEDRRRRAAAPVADRGRLTFKLREPAAGVMARPRAAERQNSGSEIRTLRTARQYNLPGSVSTSEHQWSHFRLCYVHCHH
jgi:hypothetical protein